MKKQSSAVSEIVRHGYNQLAYAYAATRSFSQDDNDLDAFVQNLPRGARILDLGCGCGVPIAAKLVSRGYSVIGLDLSPVQVRLARKNVTGGYFAIRDLRTLQPNEFKVDGIVSFHTLFHVPRVEQARLLKTLQTFLPKNAPLLVTFGTSNWEGIEESINGVPMYWSQLLPKENRSNVVKAGFDIVFDRLDETLPLSYQCILAHAKFAK